MDNPVLSEGGIKGGIGGGGGITKVETNVVSTRDEVSDILGTVDDVERGLRGLPAW